MENGTGIVRVRAEGGLHQDHRVVTAGPLSAAGKAALARTLAAAREKLEASLSERRERPASDNPVRDYQVELSLVLKLERARVIESMFRRQAYLTIQNGDAPPPRPPGTSLKHVGPFELAAGGLGWAVFFVDLGKHQETRDYRDALREVMAIDRQESIQRFNGRTDEQRRAWVDRYRELDAKRASQGLAALEGEELREFLAMDKELRYLRARIHYESATLSPL